MKKEIIVKFLYLLAVLAYFTYLATKKSQYLFCGGLLSIVASIMLIINSKNKK